MKKKLAQILLLCGGALFFSQQAVSKDSDAQEKLKSWDLTIAQGNTPLRDGFYAHLMKKSDGKWVLVSFPAIVAPKVKVFDAEEVLVFSPDFRQVQPDFRDMGRNTKGDAFHCMSGALRSDAMNHRADYNPCDSSLTSVSDLNLGFNVGLTVISFGISAVTGTSSREVVVDPEKVIKLLEDTQLIQKIQAIKFERWLEPYRRQFAAIDSIKDIELFVQKFASKDPENLVPAADAKREKIIARDAERWLDEYRRQFAAIDSVAGIESFAQRFTSKDPENLVPAAHAKREEMTARDAERYRLRQVELLAKQEAFEKEMLRSRLQAKEDEKARQQEERKAIAEERKAIALAKEVERKEQRAIAEFRNTLALGSETFCGPVINIRGPMVQIANNVAPLTGYTAEPWLKRSEIYPATLAGCINVNGRLQPDW